MASKVKLDEIQLKQIVMFLPAIKDLNLFECINKKCQRCISTLAMNPFSLTSENSYDEINKRLPSLETLYISSSTNVKEEQIKNVKTIIVDEMYNPKCYNYDDDEDEEEEKLSGTQIYKSTVFALNK